MSKSNTFNFVSKYDKSRFVPICHYCSVEGHIKPKCFKLKNSQNIHLGKKVSQNTKFNNVLENKFSNKNRIHKFSPRNKFLHNVCFSCGKFGHKDYSCYLSKYNVFNMNANMKCVRLWSLILIYSWVNGYIR